MPRITFQKDRPSIEVETGANLMKSLLDAGLPVASSCDGDGVCAKCRIQIIEGRENLSNESDLELFLKEKNKIARDFRVSCQTFIHGDIKIHASYW